ncbi:hypothetical protein, partial [Streptomyces sp. WAC05950]|uniref:hypothetical protein n=1 Tax=Streptomyces sp. WAC05950 TaxID=2487419 RepID=UPI001CA38329
MVKRPRPFGDAWGGFAGPSVAFVGAGPVTGVLLPGVAAGAGAPGREAAGVARGLPPAVRRGDGPAVAA